jgi:hypothetical protein
MTKFVKRSRLRFKNRKTTKRTIVHKKSSKGKKPLRLRESEKKKSVENDLTREGGLQNQSQVELHQSVSWHLEVLKHQLTFLKTTKLASMSSISST